MMLSAVSKIRFLTTPKKVRNTGTRKRHWPITTAARLRKHDRTGLILVEVKDNSRIMPEFYVRNMEDAAKFGPAVRRLRQEYLKK